MKQETFYAIVEKRRDVKTPAITDVKHLFSLSYACIFRKRRDAYIIMRKMKESTDTGKLQVIAVQIKKV